MKHLPLFHPFLFITYPVLSVLAASLTIVNPIQAIRPLVIYLLLAGLILLLLYFLYKDWYRAGFLTSIIIWMLFYYGYSYRIPQYINIFGNPISRHIFILCFWAVLIGILSTRWLWSNVRPRVITNFLNISSGLALLYGIYLLASVLFSMKQDPLMHWTRPPNPAEDNMQFSTAYRPDIYYIILDGYARPDVLSTVYKYDDSPFINNLKERGFYIANQSHSNYGETQLSLASSMNLEYLDYLSFAGGVSSNRSPLSGLIINSRLRTWLENLGYTVYLSGEYLFAEVNDPAIVFYSKDLKKLTTFESLLLQSTVFEILVDELHLTFSNYTYQTHREKILNGFSEIAKLGSATGPKFVFVHIIAPHPPFIFDRNGQSIQPKWGYTIFDVTKFEGGIDEYIEGYREQLIYTNNRVIIMIDQLLASSPTPPIIIIQGDHGPAARMGTTINESCLQERFSILNAYHLPGNHYEGLYPSITPVNSFRVIFNQYFKTHLDLLPDKVYYSFGDRYRFIDITQQVNTQCSIDSEK